jgi:hypothetical protein
MRLLNATNLDRKSGIRGPKTMGEAHHSLSFRTLPFFPCALINKQRTDMVTKKTCLPSCAQSKNRTIVDVRFRRQGRLYYSTALFGRALVPSTVHMPPTTGKASALVSLMTWVQRTIK